MIFHVTAWDWVNLMGGELDNFGRADRQTLHRIALRMRQTVFILVFGRIIMELFFLMNNSRSSIVILL